MFNILQSIKKNTAVGILMATVACQGINAQENIDSVSIGAGYTQQVWFSMENGKVKDEPVSNWDIAFQIPGFQASILANTVKEDFKLYRSPFAIADWNNVDTSGISSWPELHNSDTSRNHGAFNSSNTSSLDLGWGTYNMTTHVVEGDSIYVLNTGRTWKKIKIDRLQGGVYTFTYANLDGSDEESDQIDKSNFSNRNFAYYSIDNKTAVDREPDRYSWDLEFSKYIAFVPSPYGVSGVLQHPDVEVIQIDGVPREDADQTQGTFKTEINTIGNDWKDINMTTFEWDIDDLRTYFVKDQHGAVWKMYFTGFGGSSNGNYYFVKEEVQPSSVEKVETRSLLKVYPNPASNGVVNIIYDNPETAGEIEIRMIDLTGKIILHKKVATTAGLQNHALNVSNIPGGMYLIQTEAGSKIQTQKVLIR